MSEHCLIKKNTPELRKKLEDAGLSVCICTTFEDADWLSCWGSHMPYNVMEPRNKYFYKVGDKVLTPFGIQTIKDIIKDYSSQPGHEWIILVEENGNQYKPCELIGIVVKELTLEQWNQIIE